ncbi:serine protease [Candidatus Parcubacteria bacterium]|nr:serine protease [Patescibacteria group bacterium]MBU4467046.1 serine protease [Patescibacteria group bacterium]MCG2688398.1 serine protease [Candidatus Parcubacteria bacterium]
MRKNILILLLIFIFGMAGGIFSDQILWPYFVVRPLFDKYNLDQPPIYVTEKKETIVRENTALEEAIEKVSKTIVGVRAKTTKGSGLVVTNDGLVVTLSSLIPIGQTFGFYLEEESKQFQVLKRDPKTGLALVKLDADRLLAADFRNLEDLNLGERVFMVSYYHGQRGLTKTVSQGIVKFIARSDISGSVISKEIIETDIVKAANVQGSPVFDITGRLIGIAADSSNSLIEVIPVSQIKKLIGS